MYRRFIEKPIKKLAKQYPVITITGPRQSGKTTLCKMLFPNYSYVNLEDLESRNYAQQDPKGFLSRFSNGAVLDEIQRAPDIPSYIQGIVDEDQRPGRFILTGSQQFELTNHINQSLAGRTAITRLLPLAFGELTKTAQQAPLSQILYKGFYPRIHQKKLNATQMLSFYVSTYIERDLRQLINIKELNLFERFLKLCATQVGQLTNYSRLANDSGVTLKTIKQWLSILEASYIIFQLQPYHKNFRKRLTKSTKIYFYDVGLASQLLGVSKEEHIDSLPLRGALFENFIIAEFLKNRFNNIENNNLYFFRDNVGNEVDLLLDQVNHAIPIEIKSGKTINIDYFKGLKYFEKISQKETDKILIYAGNKTLVQNDIQIFSYKNIETLFKKEY